MTGTSAQVELILSQMMNGERRRVALLKDHAEPSIYGWWANEHALAPHTPISLPAYDFSLPVYIGIAPHGTHKRIADMHLHRTRVSSLRRSLAALLSNELDLVPGVTSQPKGKFSLRQEFELRLTAWMQANMTVTIIPMTASDPLGTIERTTIQRLTPLFNDTHAHKGPYWRVMRSMRAELRARAKIGSDRG